MPPMRETPSLRMREFKVVRFIPSSAAAPLAPAIRPPQERNARRMWSRSVLSRGATRTHDARVRLQRNTQYTIRRQDHCSLNHTLQFANVARPVRVHHLFHARGIDRCI